MHGRDMALSAGADPAQAKRDKEQELIFERLAQHWLDRYAKKNRSSWAESEYILRKCVLPALDATKADAITEGIVIACCNIIVDRGAPVLANRVQSVIGSILSWAAGEDILEWMHSTQDVL
jgi:hypothetical protein